MEPLSSSPASSPSGLNRLPSAGNGPSAESAVLREAHASFLEQDYEASESFLDMALKEGLVHSGVIETNRDVCEYYKNNQDPQAVYRLVNSFFRVKHKLDQQLGGIIVSKSTSEVVGTASRSLSHFSTPQAESSNQFAEASVVDNDTASIPSLDSAGSSPSPSPVTSPKVALKKPPATSTQSAKLTKQPSLPTQDLQILADLSRMRNESYCIPLSDDDLSLLFVAMRGVAMYNAASELILRQDDALADGTSVLLVNLLANAHTLPDWLSLRVHILCISCFLKGAEHGSCVDISLALRALNGLEQLMNTAPLGINPPASSSNEDVDLFPRVTPVGLGTLNKRSLAFLKDAKEVRFLIHMFRARLAQLELTNSLMTKNVYTNSDASQKRFRKEMKSAIGVAEELEAFKRPHASAAALMLKASSERSGVKALKMLASACDYLESAKATLAPEDLDYSMYMKAVLLNNIGLVHFRIYKYAISSSYFSAALRLLLGRSENGVDAVKALMLPKPESPYRFKQAIGLLANNIGLEWMRQHRFEDALEALSMASTLGSRSPWFWYRMAECAVRVSQSDLEKSLSNTSKSDIILRYMGSGPFRRMVIRTEQDDAPIVTPCMDLALSCVLACLALVKKQTKEVDAVCGTAADFDGIDFGSNSSIIVSKHEQLSRLDFSANLLLVYIQLVRHKAEDAIRAARECFTHKLDDGLVCSREQVLLLRAYVAEAYCCTGEPEKALEYLPLDALQQVDVRTSGSAARLAFMVNYCTTMIYRGQVPMAKRFLSQAASFADPASPLAKELILLGAYISLREGEVEKARTTLKSRRLMF